MIKLDGDYWNERYKNSQLGWDIGYISSPLKAYFDQLKDSRVSILIPGAGNAYEAEYLFERGFENVRILDISEEAIASFRRRCPAFPKDNIIHQDFFFHKGSYDLIVEQTFFCALHPTDREAYLAKMKNLLQQKGHLIGLLFKIPLNSDRPPFGGSRNEYLPGFKKHFEIKVFEDCYNSIPPRQGAELFINCTKKPVSSAASRVLDQKK